MTDFQDLSFKCTEMDEYECLKDIGAGSFGLAKLMRNKATQELVAMKFIERGSKVGNQFCIILPFPHSN